jgi:pyruvate formate lyase activating enzyme
MDLQKERVGLIDKIQNYCIHDGEGIRTLVFLKGCDMRCPWCSNPESLTMDIVLARADFKCENCGYCVRVCPKGAISEDYSLDKEKCDMCGKCVKACPKSAWSFYGKEMTPEQIVDEVEKDRAFYSKSGGGVTFSGGECTMQSMFLLDTLKLCREKSINTAIETNGNAPEHVYQALAPYVDMFLMDVKHMDNARHMEYTGVSNERVLGNIRRVAGDLDKKVMLRIPLIPGINDSDGNMRETAAFAAEINKTGNLVMVNILPYHSLGASKYGVMGMEYTLDETEPPPQEKIDHVLEIFKEAGVPVQQGG